VALLARYKNVSRWNYCNRIYLKIFQLLQFCSECCEDLLLWMKKCFHCIEYCFGTFS